MDINKPIISEKDPHKVTIGQCTLYLGDMRDVIKYIDPVDMICSDVPYKLTSGGNTTGEMGGKFSHAEYDNSGELIDCKIEFNDFLPLLFDVLKDPGHAYFMVNNRNVQLLLNEAENAGFKFHNLLVWDKISPTPNRWYMKNCEFTGFFYKGKAKYINECGSRMLVKLPNPRNGYHKTEKPTTLMKHYIENSTKAGDTVIDPFMGSGTTGIAAIRCGRKFIGIEVNKKIFDIACARIEKEQQQYKLI